MADIFSLNDAQVFDYENAIEEVEFLVPKYLDALQDFERANTFEEMPPLLKNVCVYWTRLSNLLKQIQALENDQNLQDALLNALQSELAVLEQAYIKVNERISLSSQHWTQALWLAATDVLERMDTVLEELGFDRQHEDRLLVKEILRTNEEKQKEFRQSLSSKAS